MAVPCTPAIAVEVREGYERQTGRRRPWARVRLRRPAADLVNGYCGYCKGFITLARCHVLVEEWLLVEVFVGECVRCGTMHWA